MGFDPLSLGIAAATTALGVGTSAAGAASQNKAISRSGDSLNRAELQRRQQNVNAADTERTKRLREARQVEGRIRAAAGATGRGVDGNFAALLRANQFETQTDLNIVDRNLSNTLLNDRTSFEAQRLQLESQQQSPLLEAFTGGLIGLNTGLQIGGAIQDFNA